MADGSRVGVLLLQLGTPAAPTPAALRPYLREFLSDRRVVDLPRAVWLPILMGIVLRTRPRASALLYKKIWTPEGSPLAVTTDRQARLLEARLQAADLDVRVLPAMRYGEPSIASALSSFAADGIDRLLAFPMYPQYAGATTGSSLEKLFALTQTARVVPSIRVVPPYFADAHYINALAAVTRESIAALPDAPEECLFSFHGLPARFAAEGDPYPVHCKETARLLAEALDWRATKFVTTFQSRFGREEWLQPYTDRTLEDMGRAGTRVAVACPGFTADCLETLEEIGLRGAEQYHEAGGRSFHRIPCLNDHPAWIDAMTAIARRELSGW
ncbi:MAG TPA: ferrochelatase [Vicinamibacterales bacterium]|nr:ferrochelatase [Vicinamibacterales bacterium]